MKKIKRYLAVAGIVLLVGLYGATVVFAMIDSPMAFTMFKICLFCTIAVPVLLYAMILVYRQLKNKNQEMYGSKIDTIIFDVGNVLVDYDWKTYLESFGFDEEKNQKLAAAMFENPAWEEADRGILNEEELTRQFMANCPKYGQELKMLYQTPGKTISVMNYACGWVQELKRKGLRVYILSNYSKRIYDQTKDQMKFLNDVDGALFSFQCHMIKPEREIYEELIRRYRIRPDRAVFIDDRQINVDGAREAGLLAMRFTTYEDTKRALDRLLASK